MDKFEQFWQLYPRRFGENPKRPARLKFEALVKKGIDPDQIVGAAEVYRQRMQAERKIDTQYVAQAITWLNQYRFDDHSPATPTSAPVKIGDVVGGHRWTGYRWAEIE